VIPHEFLKGIVAFILAAGTPVDEINATFSSPLCDLCNLSEAGVKINFDLEEIYHAPNQ
jgi:hypothetical protein